MNNDIKAYIENTRKPWGVMMYKMIWEQLPGVVDFKVLDFGSGLGITANHLAKNNEVTAIDPNPEMVEERICEHDYEQLIGGIEELKQLESNSYDVVLCHNVLEYANDREEIFKELSRVLKPNGIMSIIKHNHMGRILAKTIYENNLDEVIVMLNGGTSSAAYFGAINYYSLDDIKKWAENLNISIEKVLGIRTLFALHSNNNVRYDSAWQEKMFEIEMKVCSIEEYVNIAFYNHIIMRKSLICNNE